MKLLAVNQLDKRPSQIVASCGTTNPGDPRITPFGRLVKRTNVTALYYKHYQTTDVFNHICNGAGALQYVWLTTQWPLRTFAATWDMVETNVFLAYSKWGGPNGTELKSNHRGVKALLTQALVWNPYLPSSPRNANPARASLHYLVRFPGSQCSPSDQPVTHASCTHITRRVFLRRPKLVINVSEMRHQVSSLRPQQ